MRILVERVKVNVAESWKAAEVRSRQQSHRKQTTEAEVWGTQPNMSSSSLPW